MKKIILSIALFIVSFTSIGQVGIGTTNPDSSAALEVKSTTKGFLLPRMTEAEMNAINSGTPAEGLVVYCSDCSEKGLRIYDGSTWTSVVGSASSDPSSTATLVSDCDTNGFNGSFVGGVALSGQTFSITVTNNSFDVVSFSLASSDLTFSGTGMGSVTSSSVSPSSVSIASGASELITFTLTGTPVLGDLEANWKKLSLQCTKTKAVGTGDATFSFPVTATVISINDGPPLVDIQGVVDNGSNQMVVNVAYSSGFGSYDGYSSTVVSSAAGTGEGGDTNGFQISYPAGTFATTGTIPVTITVDGDGSFNAKKQLFGALATIASIDFQLNGDTRGVVVLKINGGVPDRNFADANHQFIYLPVTNSATGRTWLNNNLGANYSNVNSGAFNPSKQAENSGDFNAYGSLFQWGRAADGHELIVWSSSTSSDGAEQPRITSNNSNTATPNHTDFIIEPNTPYDWLTTQNDNLWQGEGGVNNPCPVGYRLPLDAELTEERMSWGSSNSAGALASPLVLPLAGARDYSNGNIINPNIAGYYLTSTLFSLYMRNLFIASNTTSSGVFYRSFGLSVRCIKD